MLKALYPPTAIAVQDREANIVIVPGVGTPGPSAWHNESGSWLEKLFQDCQSRVQIWMYEYAVNIVDKPVVRQLVDESHTLLSCLDGLCTNGTAKRVPLLLICHSLGGIILKQTLALTKDHMFKYLNTIEVISGLLFLATPHLPLDTQPHPNMIEIILRSHQRTLPRRDTLTPDDNAILAKVCHNFELIGIEIPVVSMYETTESKTYAGSSAIFRRPRQVVIVPRERGVTGSRNELAFGVNLDHNEICKIQVDGNVYRKLLDTVESALSDARSLISEKFRASSHDWEFTMRSRTTDNAQGSAMPGPDAPTPSTPINVQLPVTSAEATFGSSAKDHRDFNSLATNFEFLGRDPQLPCFSVKTHKKNDDFCGREDVLDLMDKCLLRKQANPDDPDQSSVRSFALCGMGGLGKTQIAVEYAYSRRNEFDVIIWVTADDKNLLSQEFAQVAVDLGLRLEADIQDLTTAREHVKGWLTHPVRSYGQPTSPENDASWLLIFDNVANFEVIEEFWPATGTGAILTTSRDPLIRNHVYANDQGFDLQPLSVPDSVRFMTNLTRRYTQPGMNEEGKLFKIVSYLGGLPLLLAQMAGVMIRLRLSYSDFLELYRETGLDGINKIGSTGTTPEQLRSISSRLGFDGLAPKSMGLLYLISMLDPDRIPEKILSGLCSSSTDDQFPNSLGQYFAARAQLLQTSLIHQNVETRDVWVHRIVQDVARQKLDDGQATTIYNAAVNAVSIAWPFARLEDHFKTKRYKECATIFPCVLRLKNAYGKYAALTTSNHDVATAKLFSDAGWYWYERGFADESREWFLLVQEICTSFEDRSSEETAYLVREAHHKLGTASGEMNDSKTFLTQSKIWLQLMLERKGESGEPIIDYELCIGYNEVGVSHAMNGLYDTALTSFFTAVDTFQALPNYDATMLGWTASNIGLVYWIQGNYDEAEHTLLDILAIYEAAYGKDDILSFKTGKMLYSLGNVYVSQGRHQEGFDLHARCLKQYRATLGDSNHRIGAACHRLADDNLRFNNYAEAQKLIDQAIKVFSGRSRYRPELARSLYKAGQISEAKGDHTRAASEFDESYRLRQMVIPHDKRTLDELEEVDFDNMVVFWSR